MRKKSSVSRPSVVLARAQADEIRREIRALLKKPKPKLASAVSKLVLPDQPFDARLLGMSPLYRRSRELYVRGGGEFIATLVSSPRTLSSSILLEQKIEYSPIESELVWAATDPLQGKDPEHLLRLRTYSSSLFHEQSHRILWRILPPPPASAAGLRRYLNFVESLVITLDMALGDQLGPQRARVFYLSGVTYDPGTDVGGLGLSRREYRNYLQAALHATYLVLEGYDPAMIPRAIEALFPALGPLAARAAERSGNLDGGFVTQTNPAWQRKHRTAVRAALALLSGASLALPEDPMDHRIQYIFGEKWFESFGL